HRARRSRHAGRIQADGAAGRRTVPHLGRQGSGLSPQWLEEGRRHDAHRYRRVSQDVRGGTCRGRDHLQWQRRRRVPTRGQRARARAAGRVRYDADGGTPGRDRGGCQGAPPDRPRCHRARVTRRPGRGRRRSDAGHSRASPRSSRRQRRRASLSQLAMILSLLVLLQQQPMTSDDVMGLRSLGGFALSPDGQTIAYWVSSWDKSGDNPVRRGHVWLVPSAGGAPKQLTFGDRSESAPRWAPDGKTISFVTARGGAEEKPQIWLLPVDGGEAHVLTHAKDGVETYAWSPDGSRIAYLSADAPSATDETKRKHHDDAIVFEQPTSRTHLWVASVPSGESHEVAHGDFTLSMLAIEGEPQWSPDGTRIAFVASPTGLLRDLRGTAYVATVATSTLDAISPEYRAAPVGLTQPVWSPDGRTLAFTTFPQGKLEGDSIPEPILNDGDIVLYDVASKKSRTMHEANQPATLTQLRWAPDGKSLLFVAADHVYQNVIAFDVASGHYRRLTTDKVIGSMSLNRDGSRVAFSMNTPTSPSDIYVSDLTFASPARVTTLNPQVASLALGQTEVVTYKNDGLELQGILIKPVGYQPGQRYPLLVEAHGGPTGATLDGFQNNQVWAGRGWAVFMPNPRGSEGFGESFMRANILD